MPRPPPNRTRTPSFAMVASAVRCATPFSSRVFSSSTSTIAEPSRRTTPQMLVATCPKSNVKAIMHTYSKS